MTIQEQPSGRRVSKLAAALQNAATALHTLLYRSTSVSLYLPIRTHQGDIDDKLAGNCRYRETYPTSSVPAREGSFFCLPALA